MDKELQLQSIDSVKKELRTLNEWHETQDKKFHSMFKVDEYDSLDFDTTMNVETLQKAKTHYEEYANQANRLMYLSKMGEEFAHHYYKLKFAEAKDKWCNTIDDATKKYYTSTRAEDKAQMDIEYSIAKEEYIKWVGMSIRAKGLYEHAIRRHQSATQHISILKQELNFNQFTKSNGDNR